MRMKQQQQRRRRSGFTKTTRKRVRHVTYEASPQTKRKYLSWRNTGKEETYAEVEPPWFYGQDWAGFTKWGNDLQGSPKALTKNLICAYKNIR
jgi:hypothetical protein